MKHFKTKTLAAAAVAALSMGIAGTAQAGAKAFAVLSISNFTINHSNGAQYSAGDFASLSAQNISTDNALLQGVGQDAHSAGPVPTDIDVQQAVVGTGAPGQNTFTQQTPFGGYFSRSDALLTGAIISGLGTTPSATANQVAEIELNADGNANASSVIQNGSQFTFTLNSADSITFNLTASGQAEAALNPNAVNPPSQTTAGFNFGIRLTNLDTGQELFLSSNLAQFAPISNQTITQASPGQTALINLAPTAISATTPLLSAGVRYSLSIIGNTAVQANLTEARIPEPAVLSLLGAGLLGMGATRRRRTA